MSGTHAIPVREAKCGACDRPATRLFIIDGQYEVATCDEHAAFLLNAATTLNGKPFTVRPKGEPEA